MQKRNRRRKETRGGEGLLFFENREKKGGLELAEREKI